jgi:hypothetical protein
MNRSNGIRVIGAASAELWDRIASSAPEATFYHTRVWAEILSRTSPHVRSAPLAFELADGALAVLPLLENRRLVGSVRSYDSSTPGLYGGPIAERPLSGDELESILRSVPVQGPLTKVRINGNPYASWRFANSFAPGPTFTQAVDLSSGFDAWFAASSSSNRSNVRKAQGSGMRVRLASSLADYQSYYRVYEDTLRRWGTRTLYREPIELILNARDRAGDAARLWLVEKDDTIVGGIFAVYHNSYVTGFHAASLQPYLKYKPSNLLHYEAIRDACQRGFRIYDMGPSSGQQGVVDFKDSLNARRLDYQSIVLSEGQIYRAARRVQSLTTFISRRLSAGQGLPAPSR